MFNALVSTNDSITVESVLSSSISQHALCKKLDDHIFQSISMTSSSANKERIGCDDGYCCVLGERVEVAVEGVAMIPSGLGRCHERAPPHLNTSCALQEGIKCTLAQPSHMRKTCSGH